MQGSPFFGVADGFCGKELVAEARKESILNLIHASCRTGGQRRLWRQAEGPSQAQHMWARRLARGRSGVPKGGGACAHSWAPASECGPHLWPSPWAFRMAPRGGALWRGGRAEDLPDVSQMVRQLFRSLRRFVGWDVEEAEAAWRLRFELPGFGREDVKVQVIDDKVLHIVARLDAASDADAAAFRSRRTSGFETQLTLPAAVAADKVSAELKRGVLLVTLPKVEAAAKKSIIVDVEVDSGSSDVEVNGGSTDAPGAPPSPGGSTPEKDEPRA